MPTSETSKYRHITATFCMGDGVDIGSSGDPVVPHAIQVDLETPYCPLIGDYPIHLRLDGAREITKVFKPGSLDFIYSSHLLEDFTSIEQEVIVLDWMSLIRAGGYLVILLPDKERWQRALAAGQPPNDAHKHEGTPGELTRVVLHNAAYLHEGWEIVMDACPDDNDYGIVFIAKKVR